MTLLVIVAPALLFALLLVPTPMTFWPFSRLLGVCCRARFSFPCLLLLSISLILLAPSAKAQYQGCLVIQQIPRDECEALETLFRETNGDEWLHKRGWLETNQPCEWSGIRCEGGPWPRSITQIRLVNNNVGGNLPDLARLPKLKELVIENSDAAGRIERMSGSIPLTLGDLEHLEILWLSKNKLVGSIPFELGKLRNLRILNLDGNELVGDIPSELGNLHSLERMDLSQNNLRLAIPPSFAHLDSLTHLLLHSNELSGAIPAELGDMESLRWLDLSNNELTGPLPSSLSQLDNLLWLSLAGNRLDGTVPLPLAQRASSLVSCFMEENSLCLPDTAPYQDIGLESICGLPLDATCSFCNAVSEVSQTACTAMESLFQNTAGGTWSNNTNWLSTSTPCTWFGVTCSEGAITELSLPQNNLSGPLPVEIGTLDHLTALDLSGNNLQGPLPSTLGNLSHLTSVDLSANAFTGQVPLAVATVGSQAASCNLVQRETDLCMPDTAPFQALGSDPLCGLPLQTSCVPAQFANILSFVAEIEGRDVRLSWKTDRNFPSLRFEIQQLKSETYSTIGSMESTALSDERAYTYHVVNLNPGLYTFRLKQVNPSGAFLYSADVRVFLVEGPIQVEPPYPNPFRFTSLVRFAVAEEQQVLAALYDARGQRVRTLLEDQVSANTMQTLRIEQAGLASGVYFVHVSGSAGFKTSQTVVLMK